MWVVELQLQRLVDTSKVDATVAEDQSLQEATNASEKVGRSLVTNWGFTPHLELGTHIALIATGEVLCGAPILRGCQIVGSKHGPRHGWAGFTCDIGIVMQIVQVR